MHVSSGFWNIPLKESDKEKTAFVTPFGLYEFERMPFGLVNAPASFQRAMQILLSGLPREMAMVYIDDIIVFSKSFDEHIDDLRVVLERLQSAGLKLKVSKIQFALPQVKYLGHIIDHEGIRPDTAKTEAVRNFAVPADRQEVRSFLGLAGYYRSFI
jgi:hypothetical protein